MERIKLSVESMSTDPNVIVLKMLDLDCPIKRIEICRKNTKLEIIHSENVSKQEIRQCLVIARKILLGPNYRKRG